MNKGLMLGVFGLVFLVLAFSVSALDSKDTFVPSDSDVPSDGPLSPSESTPVEGTGTTETGTTADPVVDEPAPEAPTPQPSAPSSGSSGQCKTDWTCTAFGPCTNGFETRSCTKEDSSCQAKGVKPAESQTCTVPAQVLNAGTEEATTTEAGEATSGEAALGQAPITGAVTGTGTSRNFWIAGVFILAIAVAGMLVWRRNKTRA